MTWIDYVLIGCIALSVLTSLFRGFAREAISLLAWVAAIVLGLKYSEELSLVFIDHIEQPTARYAVAFVLIFIGVIIIAAVLKLFVGVFIKKTELSGFDRLLGMAFGAARGGLFVSLLVLLAQLTPIPATAAWQQSQVIPRLLPITAWLESLLPNPDVLQPPSNEPKPEPSSGDEKSSISDTIKKLKDRVWGPQEAPPEEDVLNELKRLIENQQLQDIESIESFLNQRGYTANQADKPESDPKIRIRQ